MPEKLQNDFYGQRAIDSDAHMPLSLFSPLRDADKNAEGQVFSIAPPPPFGEIPHLFPTLFHPSMHSESIQQLGASSPISFHPLNTGGGTRPNTRSSNSAIRIDGSSVKLIPSERKINSRSSTTHGTPAIPHEASTTKKEVEGSIEQMIFDHEILPEEEKTSALLLSVRSVSGLDTDEDASESTKSRLASKASRSSCSHSFSSTMWVRQTYMGVSKTMYTDGEVRETQLNEINSSITGIPPSSAKKKRKMQEMRKSRRKKRQATITTSEEAEAEPQLPPVTQSRLRGRRRLGKPEGDQVATPINREAVAAVVVVHQSSSPTSVVKMGASDPPQVPFNITLNQAPYMSGSTVSSPSVGGKPSHRSMYEVVSSSDGILSPRSPFPQLVHAFRNPLSPVPPTSPGTSSSLLQLPSTVSPAVNTTPPAAAAASTMTSDTPEEASSTGHSPKAKPIATILTPQPSFITDDVPMAVTSQASTTDPSAAAAAVPSQAAPPSDPSQSSGSTSSFLSAHPVAAKETSKAKAFVAALFDFTAARHPTFPRADSMLTVTLPVLHDLSSNVEEDIEEEGRKRRSNLENIGVIAAEDAQLCGLSCFGLFQRLYEREKEGAVKSQLGGLDLNRFLSTSLPANEFLVLYFWFTVAHCRRIYFERLMIARFEKLSLVYQELFPRGSPQQSLPALYQLADLLMELEEASRRFPWLTRRPIISTRRHQTMGPGGSPCASMSSSEGSRSAGSIIPPHQEQDLLTLLSTCDREGSEESVASDMRGPFRRGFPLILRRKELHRGGTLPPLDVIYTVSKYWNLLACVVEERRELMLYEERCYHRLAVLFGVMFTSVGAKEKDAIMQGYGFVVARLVYYALIFSFPNDSSAGIFNGPFRADLYRLVQFWCTGLKQTHVAVRGWPVPTPEDIHLAEQQEKMEKEVVEQQYRERQATLQFGIANRDRHSLTSPFSEPRNEPRALSLRQLDHQSSFLAFRFGGFDTSGEEGAPQSEGEASKSALPPPPLLSMTKNNRNSVTPEANRSHRQSMDLSCIIRPANSRRGSSLWCPTGTLDERPGGGARKPSLLLEAASSWLNDLVIRDGGVVRDGGTVDAEGLRREMHHSSHGRFSCRSSIASSAYDASEESRLGKRASTNSTRRPSNVQRVGRGSDDGDGKGGQASRSTQRQRGGGGEVKSIGGSHFATQMALRAQPLDDVSFDAIEPQCANSTYRLMQSYQAFAAHAQSLQQEGEKRVARELLRRQREAARRGGGGGGKRGEGDRKPQPTHPRPSRQLLRSIDSPTKSTHLRPLDATHAGGLTTNEPATISSYANSSEAFTTSTEGQRGSLTRLDEREVSLPFCAPQENMWKPARRDTKSRSPPRGHRKEMLPSSESLSFGGATTTVATLTDDTTSLPALSTRDEDGEDDEEELEEERRGGSEGRRHKRRPKRPGHVTKARALPQGLTMQHVKYHFLKYQHLPLGDPIRRKKQTTEQPALLKPQTLLSMLEAANKRSLLKAEMKELPPEAFELPDSPKGKTPVPVVNATFLPSTAASAGGVPLIPIEMPCLLLPSTPTGSLLSTFPLDDRQLELPPGAEDPVRHYFTRVFPQAQPQIPFMEESGGGGPQNPFGGRRKLGRATASLPNFSPFIRYYRTTILGIHNGSASTPKKLLPSPPSAAGAGSLSHPIDRSPSDSMGRHSCRGHGIPISQRSKGNFLVLSREDGFHRPLLLHPLCQMATQHLKEMNAELKSIQERQQYSKDHYQADIEKCHIVRTRLEGDDVERKFIQQARINYNMQEREPSRVK